MAKTDTTKALKAEDQAPQIPPGTVELTRYQGHLNAASMSLTTVFRVSLFGINSKRQLVHGQYGLNEVQAKVLAKEWADLTGWKIRNLKESVQSVKVIEDDEEGLAEGEAK